MLGRELTDTDTADADFMGECVVEKYAVPTQRQVQGRDRRQVEHSSDLVSRDEHVDSMI